jgi:chromosome segregation ATPase
MPGKNVAIEALKQKINDYLHEIRELRTRNLALEGKVSELASETQKLESEKREINEKAENFKAENIEIRRNLEEVTTKHTSLKYDHDKVLADNKKLYDRLSKSESETSLLKEEITVWQNKYNEVANINE